MQKKGGNFEMLLSTEKKIISSHPTYSAFFSTGCMVDDRKVKRNVL
jgi:hypothetical protein